jgi:Uma2 family endonuclease
MLASTVSKPTAAIHYPESDGLPMSDNTRQFNWIIVLATNLRALFVEQVDVFVSGNQFWYPVEGEPKIHNSPDVYVVFGRPKGHRPSYKQWEDGGIPLTVVFEILSPRTDPLEMADKLAFYDDYRVEEYYVYDPDSNRLHGYLHQGDVLKRQRPMNGYVSPRLGIRFDLSGPELVVRDPDGRPFLTCEELAAERDQAEQRAARTAELAMKVMRQAATPEEVRELQRLLPGGPSTSDTSGAGNN